MHANLQCSELVGKRSLWRLRNRWIDNIKMNLGVKRNIIVSGYGGLE
jgi:hypothetical protein